MNHGGVCRTAPATPGLLKIFSGEEKNNHNKSLAIIEYLVGKKVGKVWHKITELSF